MQHLAPTPSTTRSSSRPIARRRRLGVVISAAVAAATTGVAWTDLTNADTPASGQLAYVATEPCRLVDTRLDPTGPLGPDEQRTLGDRPGECGGDALPADAAALALNVTALEATTPTFLTIWPSGARPTASSLNPAPEQPPIPNAVTTSLSPDGTFEVFNRAGSVHLIVDVVGHLVPIESAVSIAGPAGPAGPPGPGGPAGPAGASGPAGADGSDLFRRVVVVTGDGTPDENGDALVDALESITEATASDPWLVQIEPGTFDVPGSSLDVPSHVSLVGTGARRTHITARELSVEEGGSLQQLSVIGEVDVFADAHLERVAIDSDDYPLSVFGDDVTVRDASLVSTRNQGVGIRVFGSDVDLHDVEVSAAGFGVFFSAPGLRITNSTIRATRGVIGGVNDTDGDVTVRNSELEVTGSSWSARSMLQSVGTGHYVFEVTNSTLIARSGSTVETRSPDPTPDLFLLFNNHIVTNLSFDVDFDDDQGDAICGQNSRTNPSRTVVQGLNAECY